MNSRKLRKKIALLKGGHKVEIDGHWFRAKRTDDDDSNIPCWDCNVDCLCRGDILKVCTNLDLLSKSVWYLILES